MPRPVIMVSGGFDPVHVGHIELFERASRYGQVVVALNSDAWLTRKKGKPFDTWEHRATVLRAMRTVHKVIPVNDADGTVCEALRREHPHMFGNGGDRTNANTPELALCAKMGIQPVFGLGAKVASSSSLLAQAASPVLRPWGGYRVLHVGDGFKVKLLSVLPGCATSMQRHQRRRETWVDACGNARIVLEGEWHQLRNPNRVVMHVVEVQTGAYFGEDDIERKPS